MELTQPTKDKLVVKTQYRYMMTVGGILAMLIAVWVAWACRNLDKSVFWWAQLAALSLFMSGFAFVYLTKQVKLEIDKKQGTLVYTVIRLGGLQKKTRTIATNDIKKFQTEYVLRPSSYEAVRFSFLMKDESVLFFNVYKLHDREGKLAGLPPTAGDYTDTSQEQFVFGPKIAEFIGVPVTAKSRGKVIST